VILLTLERTVIDSAERDLATNDSSLTCRAVVRVWRSAAQLRRWNPLTPFGESLLTDRAGDLVCGSEGRIDPRRDGMTPHGPAR
jgi:hypothetical protein